MALNGTYHALVGGQQGGEGEAATGASSRVGTPGVALAAFDEAASKVTFPP